MTLITVNEDLGLLLYNRSRKESIWELENAPWYFMYPAIILIGNLSNHDPTGVKNKNNNNNRQRLRPQRDEDLVTDQASNLDLLKYCLSTNEFQNGYRKV